MSQAVNCFRITPLYIECIDFDPIARWGDAVVCGASNGIGAPPVALAGRDRLAEGLSQLPPILGGDG